MFRFRARNGDTLVEVMIAVVILGLLSAMAIRVLGDNGKAISFERRRTTALSIARNQFELLRAAGPKVIVPSGAITVNDAGEITPGGGYKISVAESVGCDGGTNLSDNQRGVSLLGNSSTTAGRDTVAATCGNGQRATRVFTITVLYYDRIDSSDTGGSVVYTGSVNMRSPGADSLAAF